MASVNVQAPVVAQPESRQLRTPFRDSKESFQVIAQGAEGVVYRTNFLSTATTTNPPTGGCGGDAALKVRYPKPWRHPILDRRLTRQRILAEARVLAKLSRELRAPNESVSGAVPAILGMSWEEGWMATEWIDGCTVKAGIRGWEARQVGIGRGTQQAELDSLKGLLRRVGAVIGRLHACGVVHGDLTTSNMMVRGTSEKTPVENLGGEMVLLDFGLAQQSSSDEDRAVDLYVLERAFGSTHPKVMEGNYSPQEPGEMFDQVLQAYATAMGKAGRVVLKKLEDVRMRGRKRSMLG